MSTDIKVERVSDEKPLQLTSTKGYGGYCPHAQIELDEGKRTVSCRACHKTLDAFDYLMGYARGERHLEHWQREEREVQKRVTALLETEKKAKARLRNANKKDADFAVNEERRKLARQRRDMRGLAQAIAAAGQRIVEMLPEKDDPKHAYRRDCTCSDCTLHRRYHAEEA